MAAKKTTKAKRKTPCTGGKEKASRKDEGCAAQRQEGGTAWARRRRRAKNGPGGQEPGAAGLRVRMYRVGFGDFFLVTVPTGAGPKHILIDCGVHSKDTHSIGAAVDHMAQETGKHLALIIVTHRHADHVTGFSKCKDVFKTFTVDRIWMSWYEDPKDEQALAIQSNIAAVVSQASPIAGARAGGDQIPSTWWRTSPKHDERRAAGRRIQAPSRCCTVSPTSRRSTTTRPAIRRYCHRVLLTAGLSVEILGPPIDRSMIGKTSKKSEEYLAPNSDETRGIDPSLRASGSSRSKDQKRGFARIARELGRKRVATVQPDMLAAKAAMANN